MRGLYDDGEGAFNGYDNEQSAGSSSYGDAPSVPQAPSAPAAYNGGVTIIGYGPDGQPIYRGSDGRLYANGPGGAMIPWNGDEASLKPYQDPPKAPTQPVVDPSGGMPTGGYDDAYGGGGAGQAIDPSYLAPWKETFSQPQGSALPGYTPPPAFSYQDWQAPEQFKPLTAQDLLKDPGYVWRENRVRDSVENSAAARGLLGSSGTLYDIGSAAGNFASQEYGAANDRAWKQWAGNFDASLSGYKTNRDNAVDQYATNYGVGKDTHGILTDRSQNVYDRAWKEFDDRRKTFFSNQDRPFSKVAQLADIGARAAG